MHAGLARHDVRLAIGENDHLPGLERDGLAPTAVA